MAIDTPTKRASAIGVGLVFVLSIIPDGTISAGDRQTSANSYSGIIAEFPDVSTPDCYVAFNGTITDDCGFIGTIDGSDNGFIGTILDDPTATIGTIYPDIAFNGIIDDSDTGFEGTITDSIGFEGEICDC